VARHCQGDLDAAIGDYGEAIRLDPRDPLPWVCRANAHFQRGATEEAIDDATVALCQAPGDYAALVIRGGCCHALGRVEDARHDLDAAIRENPDAWEAYEFRGHCHLSGGDFARAERDFDMAVRHGPAGGPAHVGRAIALFKLGRHEAALREIADRATAGPGDPDALCAHAWFLATCPDPRLRDGRRAHELADVARGLLGTGNWVCENSLAAAFAELGSFNQAAEHARAALESCPPVRRDEFAARLAAYEAGRPWRDDGAARV
jgi:tetratricopeptide (TPR) repeat protein